ncbi:MAG TPA: hypothetical protein VHY91_24400 [Pirellulales bacterium]|jgi:hypothetical protein|nr:hypothetical protein [Pirellulales bacterium]
MATPIRFFTIVLNGMPLLRYHLPMLRQLTIPWEWHIAEGLAVLRHDTAWPRRKRWSWHTPLKLRSRGWLPHQLHRGGRSIDGTSEYLDEIAGIEPRVRLFRKPVGEYWDGKREMVRAASAGLTTETLLWQLDSDELWTARQIAVAYAMFAAKPYKMAAFYWCRCFVGPELVVHGRYCYGNNGHDQWLRTWRARPGDLWQSHEPPFLTRAGVPLSRDAFPHYETEQQGLVFEHYPFVTEEQVAFKEAYYGYRGAVRRWRRLQQAAPPVALRDYFHWVRDSAVVERPFGKRLANYDPQTGQWSFASASNQADLLRHAA